jgi:hypothetical protein
VSNVLVFAVIFIVFFVLRAIAATIFFYFVLPESDRCPMCDQPTIRVSQPGWNLLLPWFRTSWCYECGWEGLLRPAPPDVTNISSQPGQLPVSSKKSS